MKVQTCEFRYGFVPVSKMLGAEEGKYRYWKIKQIPAEKPYEDEVFRPTYMSQKKYILSEW